MLAFSITDTCSFFCVIHAHATGSLARFPTHFTNILSHRTPGKQLRVVTQEWNELIIEAFPDQSGRIDDREMYVVSLFFARPKWKTGICCAVFHLHISNAAVFTHHLLLINT